MEINIANSTLRSRLGFLLAGSQLFLRIHPKHCYCDLFNHCSQEKPIASGVLWDNRSLEWFSP